MQLRPFQEFCIESLKEDIHVICVAATGSGKSLIYEHVVYRDHPKILLVSPLLALARQQRKRLECEDAVVCSPEWLETHISKIKSWGPEFLVVDECHCIEEWGREFRPAFRKLTQVPKLLNIQKSLWLTATLNPDMRSILKSELPQPQSWIGETKIPKNLDLVVVRSPWNVRLPLLKRIIENHSEQGVVFVSSRKSSERLSSFLTQVGISSCYYHAGLSSEERRNLEKLISERKFRVILCTSAFGMGMDYPWLKWAVMFDLPYSLQSLIQSVGRVTRCEDETSRAYFLWDYVDFSSRSFNQPELEDLKGFYFEQNCRTRYLELFFNQKAMGQRCNRCDLCYSSEP